MGQVGSVEQRTAIRDVLALKTQATQQPQEKEKLVQVLQNFCDVFPIVPSKEDGESVADIKDKKIFETIHSLLQHCTEQTEKNTNDLLIEILLACFRRVLMWKELHRQMARASMKPFLSCLLLTPNLVISALSVLWTVISSCDGVELNEKTEKWETANRRNFSESGGFEVLRALIVQPSTHDAGVEEQEAIVLGALRLFHLTLVSRRQTSDALICSSAINALMSARISLLSLCHHHNSSIQDFALDLVKELFLLINLEQVHELQESARDYGALLYSLHAAVEKPDPQSTIASPNLEAAPEKNLELIEMFCAGNTRSKKAMYRIIPVELFVSPENRLELISRHTSSSAVKAPTSTRTSLSPFSFDFEILPSSDTLRNRMSSFTTNQKPSSVGAFQQWLEKARSQGEDWQTIVKSVRSTHERPELVWRDEMRQELRDALEAEIESLEEELHYKQQQDHEQHGTSGTGPMKPVLWDSDMFYVHYHSFDTELVVNGYFIEHLIPKIADLTNSYEISDPVVLAWHLFDRLTVETREEWRVKMTKCLRLILRRYAMLFHGQLPTRFVLKLLDARENCSLAFIREIFLLLNTAVITTRNAPSESANHLCTLVAKSVLDVLSDSPLISGLSSCSTMEAKGDTIGDTTPDLADGKRSVRAVAIDLSDTVEGDDQVKIRTEADAFVRAGVTLLLAIVRRAKYTLLLLRPKRVFLCRLLAVQTLDNVTVTRILLILKQLQSLDGTEAGLVSSTASVKHQDLHWKSLALVYVLMASSNPQGAGMCLAAAEFLKENYGNSNDKTKHKSEFHDLMNEALGFGGCGIGRLLEYSTASSFVETFNATHKRAADVLWGTRLRTRLYQSLDRKYITLGADASLGSPVPARESHGALVHRDSLAELDDIFVGNIFLRSFVEGEGRFLNDWSHEMNENLVSELFQKLSELSRSKSVYGFSDGPPHCDKLEPWEIQVLILKALGRILVDQCMAVDIKREWFESLLLPFRRSLLGDIDQVRGILALEIFISLLSLDSDKAVNRLPCRAFLEERGVSILIDALERTVNPAFRQLLKNDGDKIDSAACNARILLHRITELLIALGRDNSFAQSLKDHPKILVLLLEHASKQEVLEFSPQAAVASIQCLTSLCSKKDVCTLLVEAGGILTLLDTCLNCPAQDFASSQQAAVDPPDVMTTESINPAAVSDKLETDDDDDDEDSDEENGATHEKASMIVPCASRYFETVRGAAMVLRLLLDDKDEKVSTPGSQALKQLLPPCLLRLLRLSPERFLLAFQHEKDVVSSTLIWTSSMRTRLQQTLLLELAKLHAAAAADVWPVWNPEHFLAADSYRYQYPELIDELVLNDVYLSKFAEAQDTSIDDIEVASFSEALLISIQSNENVLRILQERGMSDLEKERTVKVMKVALDKLVSEHPQHNLQASNRMSASMSMDELASDGRPLFQRETSCDTEDLTV